MKYTLSRTINGRPITINVHFAAFIPEWLIERKFWKAVKKHEDLISTDFSETDEIKHHRLKQFILSIVAKMALKIIIQLSKDFKDHFIACPSIFDIQINHYKPLKFEKVISRRVKIKVTIPYPETPKGEYLIENSNENIAKINIKYTEIIDILPWMLRERYFNKSYDPVKSDLFVDLLHELIHILDYYYLIYWINYCEKTYDHILRKIMEILGIIRIEGIAEFSHSMNYTEVYLPFRHLRKFRTGFWNMGDFGITDPHQIGFMMFYTIGLLYWKKELLLEQEKIKIDTLANDYLVKSDLYNLGINIKVPNIPKAIGIKVVNDLLHSSTQEFIQIYESALTELKIPFANGVITFDFIKKMEIYYRQSLIKKVREHIKLSTRLCFQLFNEFLSKFAKNENS